jgi:hypothetical protein
MTLLRKIAEVAVMIKTYASLVIVYYNTSLVDAALANRALPA